MSLEFIEDLVNLSHDIYAVCGRSVGLKTEDLYVSRLSSPQQQAFSTAFDRVARHLKQAVRQEKPEVFFQKSIVVQALSGEIRKIRN